MCTVFEIGVTNQFKEKNSMVQVSEIILRNKCESGLLQSLSSTAPYSYSSLTTNVAIMTTTPTDRQQKGFNCKFFYLN